jgi:hypothetical protein
MIISLSVSLLVTPSGIVMLVKPVAKVKADSPILVKPVPTITLLAVFWFAQDKDESCPPEQLLMVKVLLSATSQEQVQAARAVDVPIARARVENVIARRRETPTWQKEGCHCEEVHSTDVAIFLSE